jgi:hypothetical protein
MNKNLSRQACREERQEVSKERVEEMLREIAYVLHLTKRVREEMEADKESEEYAMA